jgi:hypothetical protein
MFALCLTGPTGRGFDLQEFARWAYVASASIDSPSSPDTVPGRLPYSTRSWIRTQYVRQMTLNGDAQLARTSNNVYPTGGRQVCSCAFPPLTTLLSLDHSLVRSSCVFHGRRTCLRGWAGAASVSPPSMRTLFCGRGTSLGTKNTSVSPWVVPRVFASGFPPLGSLMWGFSIVMVCILSLQLVPSRTWTSSWASTPCPSPTSLPSATYVQREGGQEGAHLTRSRCL